MTIFPINTFKIRKPSKTNQTTLTLSPMANHHQNPHAILFPLPLQGHIIPAVQLAIKLASKGFTITFVNTQSVHHQTSKANNNHDFFAAVRDSGLNIRYTTVSDGLPVEYDRSLNHDQFMQSMLYVMSAHVEVLVSNIVKTSVPPVTCLIVDTFFVWASTMAHKFGLLYASFWTEPALVFTLYYHMDFLRENRHFDCHDTRKDAIDYIPGVRAIDLKDTPSYIQQRDTTTVTHQILYKMFKDVKSADFVLCNTIEELEPNIIEALQLQLPFYSIGPLFPSTIAMGPVATSLWTESDCNHWLNSKRHGSVLYASFGSYAHITKSDLQEIANGLLLSDVSFIWALRPDVVSSEDVDPLPNGFIKAVGDRGMIVTWCCQAQVLAHPAIGGFLTHCGWNSILESVWFEVPLLCFPLLTDQFTNRKLVVDDWKVGINLIDEMVITKEEVSKNVNRFMDGTLGDQLKVAIREVKKKFKDALNPNGSSEKDLERFTNDLVKKNKF